MMSHLPEHVPDNEIIEMFKYADKDRDGRISYDEFLVSKLKMRMTSDIQCVPKKRSHVVGIG